MPSAPHPPQLALLRQSRLGVVEASAGTGKTHLLVHLAVDLILRGTPLESILLVTFTEKATHELARRLREKLEGLVAACDRDAQETARPGGATSSWTLDAQARGHLTEALLALDRASVSTIHAFCQRALAEQAFAHGLPFEQEHVAGEVLFSEVLRDWLRHALARDPRARQAIAAWTSPPGGARDGDLDTLSKALWVALEAEARGDVVGPTCDVAALVRAAHAVLAIDAESHWEAPMTAAKVNHQTRNAAVRRLLQIQDALAAVALDDPFAVVAALSFPGARAGDDPFKYFCDPDRLDKLRAVVAEPLRAIEALDHALVPLEALIAQTFLPELRAALETAKAERGCFDYQDLLGRLAAALDGPAGEEITARLRQRFRVAIIDEFQDTDPVQWKIFRRLFADSPDGHALYLIGDPKQAIYDFRGADVNTYLAARDELRRRDGTLCSLDASYRGTPGMVEMQQRLCEGLFTTTGLSVPAVTCGRPGRALVGRGGASLSPLHVFKFPAPDSSANPPRLATLHARLSERIATEIHALITEPPRWHDGARERALEPADIFVLTRSGAEASVIAGALDARGLPNTALRTESLFQGEEARWLRAVLAALARSDDRSARFAAATTGLFDFRLGSFLAEPGLLDASPLTDTLERLADLARARDWDRLFAALLDEGGIVRRRLFWDAIGQDVAALGGLCAHLREALGHTRPPLHEVLRTLDLLRARRHVQLDAPLPSTRAAVVVTSVHKSKGLEAPVVFLFGGFRAYGGPSPGQTYVQRGRRHLHLGKPRLSWEQAEIRAQRAAEDERLAYVALTRAAARLYLPFFPDATESDDKDQEDSPRTTRLDGYYRHINRVLRCALATPAAAVTVEALACPDDASPPTWTPPRARAERTAEDEAARTALAALTIPAAPAEQPRARRAMLARAARGPRTESYSRLKRGHAGEDPAALAPLALDEAPAPDDAPTETADAPAPPRARAELDALPPGTRTGIFLHELLELMPLTALGRTPPPDYHEHPPIAHLFEAALARHGLPADARAPAAALVRDALTRPLPLGGGPGAPVLRGGLLALDTAPLREAEFLYPLAQGDFMTGVLDVLFRHEGKIYGLDWKSDVLPAGSSPARHVEEHYGLQARIYATAIARALGVDREIEPSPRFGGLIYVFLREPGPAGAVFLPPGAAAGPPLPQRQPR